VSTPQVLEDAAPGQGAGLPIDVGAHLHVQVGQTSRRLDSVFIGSRDGRYLIISAPRGLGGRVPPEGTPLIVRYLHQGNAYGFKAGVLEAVSSPERLWFLSHPRQVETFHLRSYPRVNCLLPARLILDDQVMDGSVVDISRTGARHRTARSAGMTALTDRIGRSVVLEIQLPGVDGYTRLPGHLRNVDISRDEVSLGVDFGELERPHLVSLLAYLLEAHALPENHELSTFLRRHLVWKERVYAFVQGDDEADPADTLSPMACELGQWLEDEGRRKYGQLPAFAELVRLHQQLHEQVTAVVEIRRAGDTEEALRRLNALNLEPMSRQMAALLLVAQEPPSGATGAAAAETGGTGEASR